MANDVTIEVVVDLDKLKGSMKEAEGVAAESGKRTGENFSGPLEGSLLKSGVKIVALGELIADAAEKIISSTVELFKSAIDNAAEAERATKALGAALASTGSYTPEAVESFEQYAHSLQLTTGYSEDLIVKNAALLASLGKLKGEGLDQATKAALDLAAGTGMSAEQAFELLSKAANGNVTALKRYGIQVQQSYDDTQTLGNAVQKIGEIFGGRAAAQMNTFSGAMTSVKSGFGELLKSFGEMIVQSPTMVLVLRTIGEWLERAANAIKSWAEGRDVVGELRDALFDTAKTVSEYVIPPFMYLYQVGTFVFNGLLTYWQTLYTGIAEGASFLVGALAKIMPSLSGVAETLNTMADAAKDRLNELAKSTEGSLDKLFNMDTASTVASAEQSLNEVAQALTPAAEAAGRKLASDTGRGVKQEMPSTWSYLENGWGSAFSRVALTGEKFHASMTQKMNSAFAAFRDGVAGSFQSIGAALVKGENVFQAFGKAILGVFGDLAVQIGTFYFLMGLADIWLDPVAGAGEIAGGAALIALGGALKAFSGGGQAAGSFAGGGGGGGVAAGTGGGYAPKTDQGQGLTAAPAKQAVTQVNMTVQGNILDRRQTGLELAQVLTDTFGSNGVAVAGATT